MKTLLFVCTGNTCRSPMAAALARKALGDSPDWQVVSAGINALNGQAVSPHSVTAIRQMGLDISQHRAQMLTGRLVREADYIFGLTRGHVEGIVSLYPEAAEKLFVLREFEDDVSDLDLDIHDPIGGPLEGYIECRDQIRHAVDAAVRFIQEGGTTRPAMIVAMGSDHAGFALKKVLAPVLSQMGVQVMDEGTHGPESTDYPDHAQSVARKVASGEADFGILICSTGVGISIAANKVPGIRAALVHNLEGAALARQHNDANILCLGARFVSPDEALQIKES
jgi:ribose 5-phosphate isomerase B